MTIVLRGLLMGHAILASLVYAQLSGRLAGTVLADETGKPLAGATVIASRRSAPAPPTILRAMTDAAGNYAFDAAPAGSYNLCVHTGTVYLNPCAWGSPIRASTGGSAPVMRLRLGVRVVVRVDDTPGHTADRGSNRPGSVLAATLADASNIGRPMVLTGHAGGSYEYSYLVPAQSTLRLKMSSAEFLLADGLGAPIDDRGHVLSVVVPALPAPASGTQSVRLPSISPRFGPPPVVVPVKIRGRKF